MSEEQGLFEKMKTMTKEELESYYDTTGSAGRLMNFLGVGLFFTALVFSEVTWVVVLSLIGVYVVVQMAMGIDEAKAHIINILETKHKINS